jgi:hypothetical protein
MDWPYFTGAPLAADEEAVDSVRHLLRPRWLDPHQSAEVSGIGGWHYPVFDTQLTATEKTALGQYRALCCHFLFQAHQTDRSLRPRKFSATEFC